MIDDKHNAGVQIVDCLFYTHQVADHHDYQNEKLDMFSYTALKYNFGDPGKDYYQPC